MNDFGVKIQKAGAKYVATFWFLDDDRIVVEQSKKFFTKIFAIKWSKRKVSDKMFQQYIKEK